MKHICVSKLYISGSDNGLSPDRRQAIIWTNAGILLIGTLGTNFNEILFEIHTRISIWKCRLENGVHLVSASMCWKVCSIFASINKSNQSQFYGAKTIRYHTHITVKSLWAPCRLKLTVSRLFAQPFVQAPTKENQSSVTLVFVRGIHRWPVDSTHKRPVTLKSFDDVVRQRNTPICHYNDVTWASWRLKSSTTRLFVQRLVQANKNKSKLPIQLYCYSWVNRLSFVVTTVGTIGSISYCLNHVPSTILEVKRYQIIPQRVKDKQTFLFLHYRLEIAGQFLTNHILHVDTVMAPRLVCVCGFINSLFPMGTNIWITFIVLA